jgi:hypothetical protein
MLFNLLDAAKGLFTNELVGKASSFLGESGVTKALVVFCHLLLVVLLINYLVTKVQTLLHI